MIPLLPVEKYSGSNRPERLIPLARLIDDKEYAVMTHEIASIPTHSLGAVFGDASLYRPQVKAAIDFLLDDIYSPFEAAIFASVSSKIWFAKCLLY